MMDIKVKIVNDESHDMSENLGISGDRLKELHERIEKSIITRSSLTKIAEDVSEICVHPNELFYCAMQLGSWYAKHQSESGGLDGLVALLKKLKKGE